MRTLAGGFVGFLLSWLLWFLTPDGASYIPLLCLFIGALGGGWFSRTNGWVAGIITGLLSVLATLATLTIILVGTGMSPTQIYVSLLPGLGNCFLDIAIGAVAGFLGGKMRTHSYIPV